MNSSYKAISRIQWIDAMRGFSIILVVLGHVNNYSIGYKETLFLTSLFSAFRMPLFFFISGFFSYRTLDWWNKIRVEDILKRKIQAQIICTFVFCSIYQLTLGDGSVTFVGGFGGYWFTIVLFQMYICYLVFSLISRIIKKDITFLCLIIFSLLGLTAITIFHGKNVNIYYTILAWNQLTKYFQFFALGIICSKFRVQCFKLLENSLFITTIIVGWLIFEILDCNLKFELIYPLEHRVIHDILIRYVALITVIIIFYHSSKSIDYSKNGKILQFVGKRTLDIYMIHYFLLPNLNFLKTYLEAGNMFIIQLLFSIFISIVIVGLCMIISNILRLSPYLTSWLFGVKETQHNKSSY